MAPAEPDTAAEGLRPRTATPGRRAAAGVFGAVALLLGARVWTLLNRLPVPLGAVAVWAGAIVAGGIVFAALSPGGSPRPKPRVSAGLLAAAAALFAVGAWSRTAALDDVPSGFGGDEAAQVQDGLSLLNGTVPDDPFGSGWYGTMRLGMLPAAVGAMLSDDPVAGPRRPYAIAGTLALLVSMAAAWRLAGGWAALGTGALLATCAHHVHFSRIASVMVLDSLVAALLLYFLLRAQDSASAGAAFAAGAVAGLALYGYAGGRVAPATFLLTSPFLVASRRARGRRLLLAAALASGFVLAAFPNIRFAARNLLEWNSRWNQTGIFRAEYWGPKVHELGSPAAVVATQIRAGTVGLLDEPPGWPWFRGFPLAGSFPLPALAAAGAGWLFGRGRRFAGLACGLVVAGNLAATILTESAPAPQRLSSLMPVLAILGGAAVAGLVSLAPAPAWRFSPARTAIGAVTVAAILAVCVRGVPPWWDPSPGYGGSEAAFVPAAARVLLVPGLRKEAVFLDGLPYVDASFPSYRYLLADRRLIDRNPEKQESEPLTPGLHVVVPEWTSLVAEWRTHDPTLRVIPLADPEEPQRDLGYIVAAGRNASVRRP